MQMKMYICNGWEKTTRVKLVMNTADDEIMKNNY